MAADRANAIETLIEEAKTAFRDVRILVCLVAASIVGMGCAGTPQWTKGMSANPFYYQGAGRGTAPQRAENAAYRELAIEKAGIQIRATTEDSVSYRRTEAGGKVHTVSREVFDNYVQTMVASSLSAGAHIAARWDDGMNYWAYAVLPREGMAETMRRHAASMKYRAWIPGFAQYSKGHVSRGVFLAGLTVAAGVGAIWCHNIQTDAEFERDNARSERDWDYYNARATDYHNATLALIGVSHA